MGLIQRGEGGLAKEVNGEEGTVGGWMQSLQGHIYKSKDTEGVSTPLES